MSIVKGSKLVKPLTERVVKDGFRPLTVRLTEKHCVHGEPGNCNKCALALAFEDIFGDTIELVHVGPRVTKIYTPGQVTRYATPNAVRMALPVFDRTGVMPLPPGEYVFGPLLCELRRRGLKPAAKRQVESTIRKRSGAFRARALPTRTSYMLAFKATF